RVMVDNRTPIHSENKYCMVNADQDNPRETRAKETMPSELRSISVADWITVTVLCFVNLINYMDRFTIAGILTYIKHDFDIGNDKSGLLQTAFILSYMIFAPLFGYLGDRYNRKFIMSGGVFLWCLTTFIGSYMKTFGWFLFFRTLVGIGEASYSTIAPTIISDLFIKDVRSKMLALFYFAIPVGSGLGYITGGETARITGQWQWGLRITPVLGIVAILLLLFVVRDPIRGEREGGIHLTSTTWSYDIKQLLKNSSFMLSTAGFTCVAFVTGALAWWAPTYLQLGFQLLPYGANVDPEEYVFFFKYLHIIVCLFYYIKIRSTAEAFQILIAHALGDAGSPYLIGLISEGLKSIFLSGVERQSAIYDSQNISIEFHSLQYAMFLTMFVEVFGALFFFLTALHIQKDKALVDLAIAGGSLSDSVCICNDAVNSELQNDTNTILEFNRHVEQSD
ncbi:SPIN protein, partial [Acromyrmex heyeri]